MLLWVCLYAALHCWLEGMASWCMGMSFAEHVNPPETHHVHDAEKNQHEKISGASSMNFPTLTNRSAGSSEKRRLKEGVFELVELRCAQYPA